MSIRTWMAAATLLLAIPLSASAGATRHVVHGRLEPVALDGDERGRFRMATLDRSDGRHVERVEAFARRLDVPEDAAATQPSYHVFLVKEDGTAEADFGAMRVNRHGSAVLILDTRREELPSGVATITDYGGGTIEIRNGASAVMTGSIPSFVDLDDGGEGGARAFGRDRSALRPVDDTSPARGGMVATRANTPSGVREEFRLLCSALENASVYTAVVIEADGAELQLGTFTTSNPLGLGGFILATADGDTIPGGGVLWLAGLAVEVRDAGGAAVLRGRFPTLEP